jgi:nicotinate-nucleotide pyrophosphorylase (carboxylating)
MTTDFYTQIDELIERALAEDIGDGDHTTLSCVPHDAVGSAKLLVKEEGIIACVDIGGRIFHKVDNTLAVEQFIRDGVKVNPGDIVFVVTGSTHSILKAERLVLNVMQRMSGIATNTRKFVDAIKQLDAKVLDTRKTSPGLRALEKMAVRFGGGVNHRFGLYDMILIKDNHIDFSGGIENALKKTQEYLKSMNKNIPIEIEVRNFEELTEVLRIGYVNRIMLDNFTIEETKKAVELINKRFEIESSGGITIDTIRKYAECGVDFISVGELTHQVESIDLSLKAF